MLYYVGCAICWFVFAQLFRMPRFHVLLHQQIHTGFVLKWPYRATAFLIQQPCLDVGTDWRKGCILKLPGDQSYLSHVRPPVVPFGLQCIDLCIILNLEFKSILLMVKSWSNICGTRERWIFSELQSRDVDWWTWVNISPLLGYLNVSWITL